MLPGRQRLLLIFELFQLLPAPPEFRRSTTAHSDSVHVRRISLSNTSEKAIKLVLIFANGEKSCFPRQIWVFRVSLLATLRVGRPRYDQTGSLRYKPRLSSYSLPT